MLKQVIALIALSIAIVLSMTHAEQALQLLISAHNWVAEVLSDVFSSGNSGNLARGLIALLSIPFLVGLIPAAIYWIVRRSWFPYFMQIVWVVWLVQAGALVMSKAV